MILGFGIAVEVQLRAGQGNGSVEPLRQFSVAEGIDENGRLGAMI